MEPASSSAVGKELSIEHVHKAWLAAGAKGDVGTMRQLLNQHPQWLALDRCVGSTADQAFCSWEHFHLDTIGASAIHTAAWDGNSEIVELLLEAGQHPDTSDRGLTPMMVCMMRFNLVVTRCVFSNGEAVRRNIVEDCREEESRLLQKVLAVVEVLLRFGANVDARNQDHSTALHYTTSSDALEVAKLLLDNGADVDAQNQDGKTSLHQSIQEGTLLVANFLVSRGAQLDLGDSKGATPSTLALQQRDANMLQIILNHHHLVSTKQRRDFAADVLMRAVELDSEAAVHLIVHGGYASATVQNAAGESPFHRAILQQSPQMMELLSDLDPTDDTLTMQTISGDSPAHYVARYGSLRVVETLLQCLSRAYGDLDEATSPLNATNDAGATCLFTVGADRPGIDILDKRDEIIQLLLHHGARLFRRDNIAVPRGTSSAERVILNEQVGRGLTLWVREVCDRDEKMSIQDEDAARIGRLLLSEFCVEWVEGAAWPASSRVEPSVLSSVLLVVITAGYTREFLPLLVELPLLRTSMPGLLSRLERLATKSSGHVMLRQLHLELSEAVLDPPHS